MSAARDAAGDYARRDAQVVAVNPGSLRSHQTWSDRFGFDFPIAADAERAVSRAYDVLKENGTSVQRTVYIVDKAGVIRYAKTGMPSTEELLEALDGMNGAD